MSMFTHQCRCLRLRHEVQQFYKPFVLLPDLYLGYASLVNLMRYYFESYLAQIFPRDFVLFSFNGNFALDAPKLNPGNKRRHGRGVLTKASQGIGMRLASV